jgi:hypothetical protein
VQQLTSLQQVFAYREPSTSNPARRPTTRERLAAIAHVQFLYFDVMDNLLLDGVAAKLAGADEAARNLPRTLLDIELKAVQGQPSTEGMPASSQEVVDWAGELRAQLAELNQLDAKILEARKSQAPNLDAMQKEMTTKVGLVAASVGAIDAWDKAMAAYRALREVKYYEKSTTPFNTILQNIVPKCQAMHEQEKKGDLPALQKLLRDYQADEGIKKFYKDLPGDIADWQKWRMVGKILLEVAIVAVATYATAGAAGFATGFVEGLTGLEVGELSFGAGLAAAAGTTALEAFTFTSVSRGLHHLTGDDPKLAYWKDLALSFGMFGSVKLFGWLAEVGLKAAGAGEWVPLAKLGGAFGLLQFWGAAQFRVSEGHWPSAGEMGVMSAESTIVMAGAAAVLGLVDKRPNLKLLRDLYGDEFKAIQKAHQQLGIDIEALFEQGKTRDSDEAKAIQKRGDELKARLADLVKRIQGDKRIDLAKLKAELASLGRPVIENYKKQLAQTLHLVQETVKLELSGTDREFTYEPGRTDLVESGLRTLEGVKDVKRTTDSTGRNWLEVTFTDGRDALIFRERAEAQVNVDPSDPEVVKLMTDFKLDKSDAQQVVLELLAKKGPKDAQGLKRAVEEVRRELQAWERDAKQGTSLQDRLVDMRKKGIVASKAPPDVLLAADRLDGAGILRDPAFQAARNPEARKGIVGEWLARAIIKGKALAGQVVLRNVRFIGDLFEDAAGTKLYPKKEGGFVQNTDVVSEIDLLTGTPTENSGFEFSNVVNVKARGKGQGAGGAATAQNKEAAGALRDLAGGKRTVEVTRDGKPAYARIASVEAVDESGNAVSLRLDGITEAKGGAAAETLGPKGQRGFTTPLDFSDKDLQTLADVLFERMNAPTTPTTPPATPPTTPPTGAP